MKGIISKISQFFINPINQNSLVVGEDTRHNQISIRKRKLIIAGILLLIILIAAFNMELNQYTIFIDLGLGILFGLNLEGLEQSFKKVK